MPHQATAPAPNTIQITIKMVSLHRRPPSWYIGWYTPSSTSPFPSPGWRPFLPASWVLHCLGRTTTTTALVAQGGSQNRDGGSLPHNNSYYNFAMVNNFEMIHFWGRICRLKASFTPELIFTSRSSLVHMLRGHTH